MRSNRLISAAFGMVCCLSTVTVVLASTGDGATCGDTNCKSTKTLSACYACCVTHCTDATGCQDWCDTRVYPTVPSDPPSNP